jgi:hypothetical protein
LRPISQGCRNYSTDFKRVAPSREDHKVAKLETNHSLQDVPETSRLLRTAEASVLMATDSPLGKPSTPTRRSMSFEPEGRRRGGGLRTFRAPGHEGSKCWYPHTANCPRYTRENVKSPVRATGDPKLDSWWPRSESTASAFVRFRPAHAIARASPQRHQSVSGHLEFRSPSR